MSRRDFYAPTGEIKVGSYRSHLDNEEEYPFLLKIVRGWEHVLVWRAAVQWIKDHGAKVSENRGIAYINNERYFDTIQFKTNEDRLVFAIMFAEICDRGFYK
jgi:hypothetical protein